MTSPRAVPGPTRRSWPRSGHWPLVEAGLAGRPSFAIAPLLTCSGAAVIAALRVTHHPAGPFAATLVEGVLPLGTAIAVARLLGTDPALELQLSYPAAYRRTLLRRAALVAAWSCAFAAVTAAAVQETGLWAPGLARAELAGFTATAALAGIAVAAGAAAADGRVGATAAALVWVVQESLARSFAGHPVLRPVYLFATSRPGPDPMGYWANRGVLLLIAAAAAMARWLLLGRPVRLLRSAAEMHGGR
ncbi:MAG: hypothetical protein ACR2MP_29190 [Streptosporangiaceae bacterium]